MTYKEPASFTVIFKDGKICATTRVDGTIGLPGGKLDGFEDILEAAFRETEEEGWKIIDGYGIPFLQMVVNDRVVSWVLVIAKEVVQLEDYKEKHRGIKPILVDIEEMIASGRGNTLAIPIALDLIKAYESS
jgi:8-oxo-dGTP pyrophosphatase MutT (NUDIX family)